MKLYTHQQLEAAFNVGREYSEAAFNNRTPPYTSFNQFMGTLHGFDVEWDDLDSLVRGLVKTVKQEGILPTANAITQSVVRVSADLTESGLTYADILRQNYKPQHVALPRKICYYLCYILTPMTYWEIAKFYNKKTHVSVLVGTEDMAHMIGWNRDAKKFVNGVYKDLEDKGYRTTSITEKMDLFKTKFMAKADSA